MKLFRAARYGVACLAFVHVPTAAGLSPSDVYARVAPVVATLELLNGGGVQIDFRSAVRVAQDRFVTVCDGLANASSFRISLPPASSEARLTAWDAQRNLCLLSTTAPLDAGPPLQIRRDLPRPGVRVFAVSNALGLGVGISDGLVGGIRGFAAGSYIQFSAPVSPGSQGGALVDEDGKLFGIIEYRHRSGQNLNFAAPAEWIDDIEARAASQQVENQYNQNAAALARDGRWPELSALATQWSAATPESHAAWGYAAQAAEGLGETEQAERAWRTLLELDPKSTQGGLGLGGALIRQGRFVEALALAEKLVAGDRQDASLWFLYGQALHAARKLTDAEAAYRHAIELDPWRLTAYANLAGLAEARGDLGTAAEIWTKLSGLYPEDSRFRYQIVRTQLQAGQPERAYMSLARLPESETDSAAAHYWKGMTLRKLGRPSDAVEALRRSTAASPPGEIQSWIALSSTLSELRRHPEAIAAARNAVEQDPASAEARFWLAVHLKDGGRAEEALAITTSLIAEHPSDPAAWRQHGFALAVLARSKEAIPALEKSLELDPKQSKVWAALADTYHADGQADAARRAYEQLMRIDPQYARSLYDSLIVIYEEQAQ